MNVNDINPEILTKTSVNMVLETLTPQEVSACFMSLSWQSSYQPSVFGMIKLKPLFTEQNGTKMHSLVRDEVIGYFTKYFQK